jgi:glycosyltransferase involved in cell wall biosynthesis
MQSLRVLHVIPSVSLRDGGPTRTIGIIERALSAAGVKVTTLTTDHDLELHGGSHVLAAENGVRRIYAHKWLDPYKVAPRLVPHLIQAAETHDVMHIHALFSFASTAAAWVARRRRLPYVVRPLGTLSTYGMRARRHWLKRLSLALIEGPTLRHAAAVHFTSPAELDEAGALCLAMRSVVIPLGVEAEFGQPTAPLEHSALVARRVILFLSRLDPKKNVEVLIDAVASSPMLGSSCALLIAGTGEAGYVASLKARAAAAGLSDRTVWLGHVDGAQKRAALAVADVFVLPSFSENFGIAAVEALLAGVPCVLGEGVAVAQEVEKVGAGLVVPPEPTAVAQALERILVSDASVRRDMALRGKRVAEEKFSAHGMAQQLVALYEDICGRGSRCNVEQVQ